MLLSVTLWLCGYMVFGASAPEVAALQNGAPDNQGYIQQPLLDIAVPSEETDTTSVNLNAPDTGIAPGDESTFFSTDGEQPETMPERPSQTPVIPDDVPETGRFLPEDFYDNDQPVSEQTVLNELSDSLVVDSTANATSPRREPRNNNFLDDPISGQNTDSLHFDVRNNRIYIYGEGEVKYQDMTLKADYMDVNLDNKDIHAYGFTDTVANTKTRPEFIDGTQSYTMDTITYNLGTEKAKIKGVATKEGDGFLVGEDIKKMKDNTINIAHGKYTTCDNIEHPHFYLSMTKAKVLPGKKIIVGPTYFVMEDVPIPFLGIPFGFFPLSMGRQSGFIIPSYGEETAKGFFLRNGGYYFAFNDYVDATLTGGIYTLGSWETQLQTRYVRRYKYSGSFSANFSKVILGDKGSADYTNSNTYSIQWTHRQDPKFRPNSNFSASVNFSSSGYNKYGSNSLNDYLNTQTSSSIAYSKTWAGKPFSFSADLRHSQNSADSTISITFPNISFNVTTIYPFKRKVKVGKDRWYEKISISYRGSLTNKVTNVKQYDLFSKNIIDKMSSGISHSIPISTTFSLFNYLNFSPSASYSEAWGFRKIHREWSPELNAVKVDTTYGFNRSYSYSFSGSFNTKVYAEYQFLGKDPIVRAVRHVMTPTLSFSYRPDFTKRKYGMVESYQSDAYGSVSTYNPYSANAYAISASGPSASINFSLANTLEMKVRSKADTSGVKKVKLIDNLTLSSSYNFLADEFKLDDIRWSIRSSVIPGLGLNVSGTLSPYCLDENGDLVDELMWKKGKIGRITSASTSFGYSFNSKKRTNTTPAVNDISSGSAEEVMAMNNFFGQDGQEVDPATRRALMSSQYYDFDIPWNIGFSYGISYRNTGRNKSITQTLSYNGSVTLTKNWGITFNGGYDFEARKITPGVFTINRDLHCWQMSFSWVPVGWMQSWSFNIHIKSSVLRDIKYDKANSYYDNIYY